MSEDKSSKAKKTKRRLVTPQQSQFEKIVKHNIENNNDEDSGGKQVNTTETKKEKIPFSSIRLNYKNKRVITQLLRYIPDKLVEDANKTDDPILFIKNNISQIPINNIINEFQQSNEGDEILKYPNHSDIYDVVNEGIFVGKGICFSNINTEDKCLLDLLDKTIVSIIEKGTSLETSKDVPEKPQVIQTGGQRFSIVFGTQRYTYLVFHHGLDYVYSFNLALSNKGQNYKIYLENNLKENETGYEKLLSQYFTVEELCITERADVEKALSISRSRYFQVAPFIKDFKLLEIVKASALNMSMKQIFKTYAKTIKSANSEKITEKAYIYDLFEQNLLIEAKKKKLDSIPKGKVSVQLPVNQSSLEKLLFTDVREWMDIDVNSIDFQDNKSIKKFLTALIESSLEDK